MHKLASSFGVTVILLEASAVVLSGTPKMQTQRAALTLFGDALRSPQKPRYLAITIYVIALIVYV